MLRQEKIPPGWTLEKLADQQQQQPLQPKEAEPLACSGRGDSTARAEALNSRPEEVVVRRVGGLPLLTRDEANQQGPAHIAPADQKLRH